MGNCCSNDKTNLDHHADLTRRQDSRASNSIKKKKTSNLKDSKAKKGAGVVEDDAQFQEGSTGGHSDDDNVRDKDYHEEDVITLQRKGVTTPLFGDKEYKKVKPQLELSSLNVFKDHSWFRYRPCERDESPMDDDQLEMKKKTDLEGDAIYYYGQWDPDAELAEGKGIMIYKDGSSYDGIFHLGLRHGAGRMIYNNGDIYQGEWKNDKVEGYGTFVSKEGTSMKGKLAIS